MTAENAQSLEIDIRTFIEEGKSVPEGQHYIAVIDGGRIVVDTLTPTEELLLGKVGKKLCGYRLVELIEGGPNRELEPDDKIDLRERGLRGFITAQPAEVTIFIGGDPKKIARGEHTADQILEKVGRGIGGFILLQEKDGRPPEPVSDTVKIEIKGCEEFTYEPRTGSTS